MTRRSICIHLFIYIIHSHPIPDSSVAWDARTPRYATCTTQIHTYIWSHSLAGFEVVQVADFESHRASHHLATQPLAVPSSSAPVLLVTPGSLISGGWGSNRPTQLGLLNQLTFDPHPHHHHHLHPWVIRLGPIAWVWGRMNCRRFLQPQVWREREKPWVYSTIDKLNQMLARTRAIWLVGPSPPPPSILIISLGYPSSSREHSSPSSPRRSYWGAINQEYIIKNRIKSLKDTDHSTILLEMSPWWQGSYTYVQTIQSITIGRPRDLGRRPAPTFIRDAGHIDLYLNT